MGLDDERLREVKLAAYRLIQNAQAPTTPEGFVMVRKGDFEALSLAVDRADGFREDWGRVDPA